ncbi:MAG: chorismate mutase [Robiginitomaculum sp.]
MSDNDKTQAQKMQILRDEINQVDGALLDLIAERMDLARAVRQAKSGIDVWCPSREESHVRDLARKAGETPPDLVSRIWAELTSASLTLQGPIQLHVAISGDALSYWQLVRDRFGASIPVLTYPTASAALAAAHADAEGVAVLPAPGGMNTWWLALGPDGAASDMSILSALPRVGKWKWPLAVAVSKAERVSSGNDHTLIYVNISELTPLQTLEHIFKKAGIEAIPRAEVNDHKLYSIPDYMEETDTAYHIIKSAFKQVKIIGLLPSPITTECDDNHVDF